MRSVVVSVIAFVIWLGLVMALTIWALALHRDVESARVEQIEALKTGEAASPTALARLDEQALRVHNLFTGVAVFLTVLLAFGLVSFTIWIYRLAAAARDARELIEFSSLSAPDDVAGRFDEAAEALARASTVEPAAPTIKTAAESVQPDLLEPEPEPVTAHIQHPPRAAYGEEHVARERPPESPAEAPMETSTEAPAVVQAESPAEAPASIRAATTVVAKTETATDVALDEAFAALAPEEKERQCRLDLVRHAGLEFPELGAELRQLLSVTAEPKAYIHQLVREIGRHPVLSSKLIRLANTLYYSPPKPVRNLNFALVVLGTDGIRSAALAQAVHDAFDFSRPFQVELWHHSIAVAIAAGLIGRAARHPKPDELYALGLVHALGKMVLLHNRGGEYAKLADLMQIENVPAREVEREAFAFTSGEVGLVALALWNLPRAMQGAVLYGGELDAAGLGGFGREAATLATALSAADAVAKKVVAVATIPADADVNLAAHRAVKALNLSQERLDDLCQDLRDNYQEQRGFL